MRRAISIAAAAVSALLLPVAAASGQPTFLPAPPPPQGEVALRLAEHAGLTLGEAERRLEIQERAAGLWEELRTLISERFAGVWLDRASGDVRVGLLDEGDRRLVEAALKRRGIGDFALVAVPDSRLDLEAAMAVATRELEALNSDRWAVKLDDAHNRLTIELLTGAPEDVRMRAQQLKGGFARGRVAPRRDDIAAAQVHPSAAATPAVASRLGPARERRVAIAVEAVDRRPAQTSACNSGGACDPPLRGGQKILNGNGVQSFGGACSAGFIGTWWSGSATYVFTMTAGHCQAGQPSTYWRAYDPSIGSSPVIGQAWAWNFGGGSTSNVHQGIRRDIGHINVDLSRHWSNVLAPVIRMNGWSDYWGVTGDAIAVPGEFGCRSGFASTFTCGFVSAQSASVPYLFRGDLVTVDNVFVVPGACPAPGDSGGPFIDGGTALGVTSGRGDFADGSCEGYFAHVADIEYWLGVHVWD